MPIYEYRCKECENTFEVFADVKDDKSAVDCIQCGGKVKRIFSPVGILFQGPGFYSTDNRK